MQVRIDSVIEVAIHHVKFFTVPAITGLKVTEMGVFKLIDIPLYLLNSVEQVVILGQELVNFTLSTVDLL